MDWKTITTSRDARFLVKGVELANVIVGDLHRFQVCEHRTVEHDRSPGVVYRVRDAETVTDAEVRDGVRPHVVASFKDFDEAIAFVSEKDKREQ